MLELEVTFYKAKHVVFDQSLEKKRKQMSTQCW